MRRGEVARRFAVYVSLTSIALAQPMLQLYGGNLAVFTSARFSGQIVLWFALAVTFVPPFALLAVDVLVSSIIPRRSNIVHHSLFFLGAWTVTSMFLRGVSVGPWIADAALTAVSALALTAIYSQVRSARSWVAYVSPLSIAALVLFVVSTSSIVWPPRDADAATSAIGSGAASSVDVVWIQLDEAPLFPLVGTDGEINAKRFPGFAKLASVSSWYRNVTAVSQRTAVAVPAMLTGTQPRYTSQPVLADFPQNLFTMVKPTMKLDVSEAVTSLCIESWCTAGAVMSGQPAPAAAKQRRSFRSFVGDAAIVLGHKILPAEIRERLPAIDEGWGGFGHDEDDVIVASEATDDSTATPVTETSSLTGHAARIMEIENVVTRQTRATDPTLRFAHVMLPHRPWVLAPDQRRSGKPIPDIRPPSVEDRRRDAYQSFLNQYVALDAEIGKMVDSLSASPNWSRTMLIVTADHGLTFVPGESYRDQVNPRNPQTLDDIYRVPLFIRYPGQLSGDVNDCTATVVDILPTVAGAVGIRPTWTVDGSNLQDSCPLRPSRTVTWIKGQAELATDTAGLTDRVRYYDAWVDADGDVDDIYRVGPAGSLLGTSVPERADVDTSMTWSLSAKESFSGVSGERFGAVPTRAVGRITARSSIAATTEVLVAVDGRFVGEVPEVAGLKNGQTTYFAASLMSRLIGPGDHTVELWSAVPDGGTFVLRKLG